MPRAPSRPRAPKASATVTRAFLFSDLRGWTDFVEKHGDSAAAELIRSYRDLVRAEIAKHSGAEVKTEGDSFYLVFESPKAAVECAVHIQRAAADLAAQEGTTPLAIGIGLHAGETVPYDDQFVGSAVNIAARLASKAKAGEIVVSDTLRGLVRTAVQYAMADRGPLKLKGVSERVRAYSIEWRDAAAAAEADRATAVPAIEMPLVSSATLVPSGASAPGQIVCPVVVGRDAERARFVEHLDLAASGRGQAAIVSGEAGVGKSAFVREALAAAAGLGFRILYGATLESDSGLPYAPFVAAIRSGFRGIARDRLGRVLAQAAPDLAQLFPELGKAQRAESASAAEQHRLSVAFLGLFTTFAADGPVLVVAEDLHWADEASLGLFHYLARELRDSRVLLLGTYRSDEMHRRHPLLRALAGMQRERVVSEITLGRLDRDQVKALITATFARTDPDVRVGDEFRDAIYERSEGNPFFTEELLRSLVESGDVYYTPEKGWERKPIAQLRIPGSVREAVRERIDRLGPDAQTTISAAAVIGLRFPFELLRAVRGATEGELETQLREAMELQLLVELGGDEDEYGFRHALTKEVVYDDLLVRERKRLHRGVADALIVDGKAEPGLVGHHLLAAGDSAAAVPHLLAAADRAFRAFAPREAAAQYEKAIEIGLPDDRLAATLEALAETYHLFDFALSRKAADEAAQLFRARGDQRGASRMLRLASRSIWQQGDPTRAAALGQEAIDVLDGLEETRELGRALANLGILRMLARHDDEAVELSERAMSIGERFDDPWTVANGMVTKGTSLGNQGRDDEGRTLLRAGLDLALARGQAEVALRAYNNLLLRERQPDAYERLLEEGIAFGQRHGVEHPILLSQRTFWAMIRGDWDEAIAMSERIPEGSVWHGNALGHVAHVTEGREGPDRSRAFFEERASANLRHVEAQRGVPPLATAAANRALAGDLEGTRRWLEEIRRKTERDMGSLRLLGGAPGHLVIVASAFAGEPDWADRLEAVAPAEGIDQLWTRPMRAAVRAIFAGDAAAAGTYLAQAYEEWDHVGAGGPYPLIVLARAVHARGLPLGTEWRAMVRRSREFCERARASWLLAQLDEIEGWLAT